MPLKPNYGKKTVRKSTHADIREALRKMPDGLTVVAVSSMTGLTSISVRRAMQSMPDVYIDRWEQTAKTKGYKAVSWTAVYVAVDVPEDCPKP